MDCTIDDFLLAALGNPPQYSSPARTTVQPLSVDLEQGLMFGSWNRKVIFSTVSLASFTSKILLSVDVCRCMVFALQTRFFKGEPKTDLPGIPLCHIH